MANYQNHLVDPTFFWDAIEEFAFDYDLYVLTEKNEVDEYGNTTYTYDKTTIRGSLQSQGLSLSQEKKGNKTEKDYNFYCKSLYRINIGDVIEYKNNFFLVDSVQDYDEWGVRSCSVKGIQLTAYRDLADYVAYINGEKIV